MIEIKSAVPTRHSLRDFDSTMVVTGGETAEVARHAAAFATLIWRYTGEERIALDIAARRGTRRIGNGFSVEVALGKNPPAHVMLHQLCADMDRNFGSCRLHNTRLTLTWRNAVEKMESGAGTGVCAAHLQIESSARITWRLSGHQILNSVADPAAVDSHFATLLNGFADAPDLPVGELPLLTDAERFTILSQWSGAAYDPTLVRDETLAQLFEAQVDQRPDAIALSCAGEELTYAELESRANRLARYLRSRGVRRGDYVAMLLPRSNHVYVALLAILKAGAAYAPLDPEYPADRVAYILDDCNVHTLITIGDLLAKHTPGAREVVCMDAPTPAVLQESTARLSREETGITPQDPCYVIYTSGSTGRPKGVQILHRNACNLVRAEGKTFAVQPEDRVFQGFSVAFDASVEEIWLAFFSGATLVVGTSEMVHAGPELSRLLTEQRVTVLSCVPTLLSMMSDDVPTLRILILGGEQCQQTLVDRWTRPGRRMVNTYGPTEATVIATYTDCAPGQAVTIGRPVPNYQCYILDSRMQPLPAGIAGELHIGGDGLAAGYLGRPELTAQKFVPNPFSKRAGSRLYKTGDLVRFTLSGDIEFLGRIDAQVKIRGFRVELSEIEVALMQCPSVQSAVVALREDVPGIQQLVGYAVPCAGHEIDEEEIKRQLRSHLPPYMIPAVIETVADFPTLASGKVDRKRLPALRPRTAAAQEVSDPPQTDLEKKIAIVWEKLFQPAPVTRTSNFFKDLGGHSLLAARMVSELRNDASFRDVSMIDVYNCPTPAELAKEFETRRESAATGTQVEKTNDTPRGNTAFWLTGAAQAVALYFVIAFASVQWLAPYLAYNRSMRIGNPMAFSLGVAVVVLLAMNPLLLLASVAAKWLLIGRFKPGQYPLWSFYYLRWWLVNRALALAPTHALTGTPLFNLYLRLMGAKVGRNVFLGTDHVVAFDLLTIGDDTSIGLESSLLGYTVEDGMLKIGPIAVGSRCFVGARSMLQQDTRMEDDSSLSELGLLPVGGRIPQGEVRIGSPARPLAKEAYSTVRPPVAPVPPSRSRRTLIACLHAAGVLVMSISALAAMLPGALLLIKADEIGGVRWVLLASLPTAMLFVVSLLMEIAALKWLLLGRVKPGSYSLQSWFYVRKWFVDQFIDSSLTVLGPVYATLYLGPWYRLLGVRLGKNAEISTAHSVTPDLLRIDDGSFIADSVSLGAARVDRGVITLAPVHIGRRTFIGNSATVCGGSTVGDGSLIGVMSAPPLTSPGAAQPSTSWLGSPSIFLPKRQQSAAFDERTTYAPTPVKYLQRAGIEFFRIFLPPAFGVFFGMLLLLATVTTERHSGTLRLVLLFPLLDIVCGIAAVLVVIAAKWLLMGRYRPAEQPLWSTFVWRTELVTALHEHLANPMLVNSLIGTPFIGWFFRLLGAKVGSRVYMETTALTEFDLITIGDDVALNQDCTMQTHLFEDRVMKMSTIRIGTGCSAGARSVVLYDSMMEDGSTLGDLSLLMKGESLPADTRWVGTPARRAAEEAFAVAIPVAAENSVTARTTRRRTLLRALPSAVAGWLSTLAVIAGLWKS